MTLRILLLFFSISILSACGGGGGPSPDPVFGGDGDGDIVVVDGDIDGDGDNDIGEENPEVELQIVKTRNWVAVEGSTLELIPYGRVTDSGEDFSERTKGDIYWIIISGSEYASIEQVQRRANVTALNPCPEENPYCVEVELKLDSSTGEIYTETAKLLVKQTSDNLPPEANAGADQTVTGGNTVTLDGSASYDLDGSVANYTWSVVSGAVSEEDITGINTATPSFIAPESKYDQNIVLKLVVTDDQGLVNDNLSTVTITVLKTLENIPPQLDPEHDKPEINGRAGDRLSLTDPIFMDTDGTLEEFAWEQNLEDYPDQPVVTDWVKAVKSSNEVTKVTLPIVEEETILYFTYTVTDNDGDRASTEVQVTVIPLPAGNMIPVADLSVYTIPSTSRVELDSETQPTAAVTINENSLVCFDANNSRDPDENSGGLLFNWELLGIEPSNKIGTLPSGSEGCVSINNTFEEYASFIIQLTVAETADSAAFSIPVELTVNVKPVPEVESLSFSGSPSGTDLPVTANSFELSFTDEMSCNNLQSFFSITDIDTGALVPLDEHIECGNRKMTFKTAADELTYGHAYTAKLLTTAENTDGNNLSIEHGSEPLEWNFNILPATTLASSSPDNGADNVSESQTLTLTFDRDLECSTVSESDFIMKGDGATVGINVACEGEVSSELTVSPKSGKWTVDTAYVLSVLRNLQTSQHIKDMNNNPLAPVDDIQFTIGSEPVIIGYLPSGGYDVSVNTSVQITFSEAMDCDTLSDKFELTSSAGSITLAAQNCDQSPADITFVFERPDESAPPVTLAFDTLYTLEVSQGVKSKIGNALPAQQISQFETELEAPVLSYAPWDAEWVKSIKFEWGAVTGADYYQLVQHTSSNPGGDIIQNNITDTTTIIKDISVHQFDWTTTTHSLKACKHTDMADVCSESEELHTIDNDGRSAMLDAIGYLKSSYSSYEAYFGQTVVVNQYAGQPSVDVVIAVGAHHADQPPYSTAVQNSGVVHVYRYSQSKQSWNEPFVIMPSHSSEADYFGLSIAISADGNRIIVGAPEEDGSGTGLNSGIYEETEGSKNSGAVYVFDYDNDSETWNQVMYLKSDDPDDKYFGGRIALDSNANNLIVQSGVTSAVDNKLYFYDLSETNCVQTYSFLDDSKSSMFGWSMEISGLGDRLFVTGYGGDLIIFRKTSSWKVEATISITGEDLYISFLGVNYAGDRFIWSNPSSSVDIEPIIQVYEKNNEGDSWDMKQQLQMPEEVSSWFGSNVAMSGDGNSILIADMADSRQKAGVVSQDRFPEIPVVDKMGHSGAVYVYQYNERTSTYSFEKFLKSANPGLDDSFGTSYQWFPVAGAVDINYSGTHVVVGAPFEDSDGLDINSNRGDSENYLNSGAVYLY